MASQKTKNTAVVSGEELYELKHKETGFFDSKTGFKIVRDEQKPLGETVGDETQKAIASGRLVLVREKKTAEETSETEN